LDDLAESHPAKSSEVRALFDQQAKASKIGPLVNRSDLFPGFRKFREQAHNQND
jgi:hypothetical protein